MEDYVDYGAMLAGKGVNGDGEAAHHVNLTVFPLFLKGAEAGDPGKESERYVLLDNAIEAGQAVVEEIDEGGAVSLLAVSSTAIKPILIPEGQILVGAKQDRTVNLTVLVAAGKSFRLPVSCIEQGRWNYQSRRFRTEAYFAGALSDPREVPQTDRAMAEAFLASVTQKLAPAATQPEVGFEMELGGELDGAALWHEGAICHLAAFSVVA